VSRDRLVLTAVALALAAGVRAAGCAELPGAEPQRAALLALSCDDVDTRAVRDVLAQAEAPRIVLIAGSLPWITMEPFARFLAGMGYPAARLRDPRDGALSQSGYEDSAKLAGLVAWHYEHDAMAPMLIGHSRGGMVVVRTLHELAGAFGDAIPVWDPVRDEPLARTTIVDPYTRRERPVVGLTVDYAAAIATGRLPRLLQGQWSMLKRLHAIPDTVRDFTAYTIPGDLIAGSLLDREPYAAQGRAQVRNVELPATTLHVDAVRVDQLAADPVTRAWIDAYRPGSAAPLPPGDTTNLLEAADVWYGVRTAWCRAAQAKARADSAREAVP
jgi:hypothetical protein